MTQLRPCPECQRHVRVTETACPFCSAALEPAEAVRRSGSSMTRAAIFAGATLLASGCGDKTPEPREPDDQVEQSVDAAPIDDGVDKDGNRDPEAVEKERAEKERLERERLERERREREIDRDVAKPYGAPPSRERLV